MYTAICGFILFCLGICLPAPSRHGIEVPPPEVLRFMRRFGYLDQNPDDSEALYHETAIVEAIKNVQKFGALNQTGKLDQTTLDLFKKPRCGVRDIEGQSYYLRQSNAIIRKKRFVFGAGTWTKRRIRYFIGNWSLKVPPAQVESDIARALSAWSQCSGLKFEHINDTSADIIIGFGTRYHGDHFPFDGAGNILAHAFYPYEMESWGGDVHFDEDENWQENATDLNIGVDFYSVALHELGHSLGLAHSPSQSSIMFPYYKGPGHNVLDYDDTLAMYNAYLSRKLEDDIEEEDNYEQEDQLNEPVNQSDIAATEQIDDISSNWTQTENKEHDKNHHNRTTSFIASSGGARDNGEIPDICLGNFDAVCYFNESVHVFKEHFAWRLTPSYTILSGYPIAIEKLFLKFPNTVTHIDACYERYDKAVVLFMDQHVWIWRDDKFIENSPKPLPVIIGNNSFIIPRINAAMLWPKNNLTYVFGETMFWRYNDYLQQLDAGYPKTLKRWPGLPQNLNAAATLPNGKTYFFKDNLYWLYNNVRLRPERGYPRRASIVWLGCSAKTVKLAMRNSNTTASFIATSPSSS